MTTEVTDAVDVAAYFDRIGYRGPAEPTVETVHALVVARNRSIPATVPMSRRASTRCWTADHDIPRIVGGQRHRAQPPRILRCRAELIDPAACPHCGQAQPAGRRSSARRPERRAPIVPR
jgi:hypothetical protein